MAAGAGLESRVDEVVEVSNAHGGGQVVIACEHASNHIPLNFKGLGLSVELSHSHIAWDPGALNVAREMATLLDAPLVASCVSRLVFDCNRDPNAPSAVPDKSEIFDIPGNIGLSVADREARAACYHAPFHTALAGVLDARRDAGQDSVLVTVHSFTPTYLGVERAMHLGVVHDEDAHLADAFLDAVGGEEDFVCRRNEPYGPADGVTYTLAAQALGRGLRNIMLEIRNDLIRSAEEQRDMAVRLTRALNAALSALASDEEREAI